MDSASACGFWVAMTFHGLHSMRRTIFMAIEMFPGEAALAVSAFGMAGAKGLFVALFLNLLPTLAQCQQGKEPEPEEMGVIV